MAVKRKARTTQAPHASPLVQGWRDRITHARDERRRLEQDWNILRSKLLGEDRLLDWTVDGMHIDVNLAHSHLQTMVPKVMLQNPKMTGQAKRKGSERAAKLMAALDNYYIDEMRMVPEYRECVADASVFGIGVLKVGYLPTEKDYPTLESVDPLESEIDRAEATIEALASPHPPADSPFSSPAPDPSALIDPLKKRGGFFAERIAPQDFLWDAYVTKPRYCRWMAHEYVMPVSAIRKEKRFDKGARNQVTATQKDADRKMRHSRGGGVVTDSPAGALPPMPTGTKRKGAGGLEEDTGYDKLVEIWDWENQKLITLAESVQVPLQEVDWPYPTEGPPFAILRFNITPDEMVPVSDLSAAKGQLDEIRYIRAHRAQHIRRFNRKYLADPSVYEQNESMQALEEGDDGTIIKGTPGLVQPLQDATVSPDYDRHESLVKQDFREITAQSELERGVTGDVDTATAAAILDANSKLRSNYLRGLTETFVEDGFRILNQLLRAFLQTPVMLQIIGDPEAEDDWLAVTREDLQGEFDVKVIAGSTLPGSEMQKQQRLTQLLGIMQPFIQAGLVNPLPLLREIAETFEIKDVEAFLGLAPRMPDSEAAVAQPDMLAALMTSGASGQSRGGMQASPADAVSAAFGRQGGGMSGGIS